MYDQTNAAWQGQGLKNRAIGRGYLMFSGYRRPALAKPELVRYWRELEGSGKERFMQLSHATWFFKVGHALHVETCREAANELKFGQYSDLKHLLAFRVITCSFCSRKYGTFNELLLNKSKLLCDCSRVGAGAIMTIFLHEIVGWNGFDQVVALDFVWMGLMKIRLHAYCKISNEP